VLLPSSHTRTHKQYFIICTQVRDELGMIPIIWDDMLRQQGPRLIGSELTGIVEPMVWVYTDDITRLVPHYIWHTYASMFPNIWAASAFKVHNHQL